ncbi:MAG: Transcriptional activator RfaH [Akkermansiaceae bacterium]|nr:Transcriptional activator RfaH [Akkermansiaceae bacterium]
MTTENADPQWYCVKTQPKRESTAAARLRELEEIEVFAPMLRYRKVTRRGKIWWVEAFFPGYILARFDLPSLEKAVTYSAGVRGLVKFGSLTPPGPAAFVELIRAEVLRQGTDEILTLLPRVEKGEEVEVAAGPLGGSKGTVVEVLSGTDRVRVLLEFLGRERIIEIDLFSLLLPRKPLP